MVRQPRYQYRGEVVCHIFPIVFVLLHGDEVIMGSGNLHVGDDVIGHIWVVVVV